MSIEKIKQAINVLDEFPETQVFVIPVRLDPCTPSHERLNDLQMIDMFPSWNQGLDRILQSIEAHSRKSGRQAIARSENPFHPHWLDDRDFTDSAFAKLGDKNSFTEALRFVGWATQQERDSVLAEIGPEVFYPLDSDRAVVYPLSVIALADPRESWAPSILGFSTAGALLAGPLGGVIGALVGAAIDVPREDRGLQSYFRANQALRLSILRIRKMVREYSLYGDAYKNRDVNEQRLKEARNSGASAVDLRTPDGTEVRVPTSRGDAEIATAFYAHIARANTAYKLRDLIQNGRITPNEARGLLDPK